MRITTNPPSALYAADSAMRSERTAKSSDARPTPEEGQAATVHLSRAAIELSRAQQALSQLEAPRPEAIERARQILAKWSSPDDQAVDRIIQRLSDDI